jgi:FkbM family methyltransferase
LSNVFRFPDVGDVCGNALLTCVTAAARIRLFHKPARKALILLRSAELVPRHFEGSVNGRKILLDMNEMVDQKVALFGAFDARGLGLIKLVMKVIRCRTAIDVGANIGNHTAFFSDWARDVVAIEPNPPVFARLKRFVDENGLSNVTPVQVGLSDRNGALRLYATRDRSHLATLEPDSESAEPVEVPIERGDDLLARLGATEIDLIKIDVEGHEHEVLAGLERTIATQRPVLVVEFVEKSIAKFGSSQALAVALPGYAIYGTRTSLFSRIFKTALSLEEFRFGKIYTHIVCVPKEWSSALTGLTRGLAA